jgi:hypothetical protein
MSRAYLYLFFESKNLGLSRKHEYVKGIEIKRIAAKNKNVYLHVGSKPNKGKHIGVPAHVIVSIFIAIVLNLIAKCLG